MMTLECTQVEHIEMAAGVTGKLWNETDQKMAKTEYNDN